MIAAWAATVPPRLAAAAGWPVWRFALGYFRQDRLALIVFGLGTAVQAALAIPVLLLVRMSFDVAIPRHRIDLLALIGATLIALRAVRSVLAIALRARGVRIVRDAGMRLRRDLIVNLLDLSDAYLFDADRDQLQTRIITDTERVDQLSDTILSQLLPGAITLIVLAVMLLHLNAMLVAVGALVVPLAFLTGRKTTARAKADVRKFHASFEAFSRGVRFVLDHGTLIRLRAAEAAEAGRQVQRADRLRANGLEMALSFARHGQLQASVAGLGGVLVLVAGGAAIIHGSLSLGGFMAFYAAAGMVNGQVSQLGGLAATVITASSSLAKLMAMHAIPDRKPYRDGREIDWQGRLAVEAVDFAYPGGRALLRRVSLMLQPGETVAIVGANGSGKTSLMRLLLGLARPDDGRVAADGVPFAELNLDCVRRHIGVVPQHPGFFAGSVRENLAYGVPEADADAITRAVSLACAGGLIGRLPQGLDTPIGDGGATLSGGERQLLAVARALVGRPKLLILDEPTNHLDLTTIGRLMASLGDYPEPLGILIISHDPAVVARAHRVYELQAGRLRRLDLAANDTLLAATET